MSIYLTDSMSRSMSHVSLFLVKPGHLRTGTADSEGGNESPLPCALLTELLPSCQKLNRYFLEARPSIKGLETPTVQKC